jgi:hypothetical protein
LTTLKPDGYTSLLNSSPIILFKLVNCGVNPSDFLPDKPSVYPFFMSFFLSNFSLFLKADAKIKTLFFAILMIRSIFKNILEIFLSRFKLASFSPFSNHSLRQFFVSEFRSSQTGRKDEN